MFTMPFAGMAFVLLLITIVGGLKLLEPVANSLAAMIDRRAQGADPELLSPSEVEDLRRSVEELQSEVHRLTEAQEFTERLLEARSSGTSGPTEP